MTITKLYLVLFLHMQTFVKKLVEHCMCWIGFEVGNDYCLIRFTSEWWRSV